MVWDVLELMYEITGCSCHGEVVSVLRVSQRQLKVWKRLLAGSQPAHHSHSVSQVEPFGCSTEWLGLEGASKIISFQASARGRDTSHSIRLLVEGLVYLVVPSFWGEGVCLQKGALAAKVPTGLTQEDNRSVNFHGRCHAAFVS